MKFLLFVFFFIVFAILKAVASLGRGVTQIAKSAYEQVYEPDSQGLIEEILFSASKTFNRSFRDLLEEIKRNNSENSIENLSEQEWQYFQIELLCFLLYKIFIVFASRLPNSQGAAPFVLSIVGGVYNNYLNKLHKIVDIETICKRIVFYIDARKYYELQNKETSPLFFAFEMENNDIELLIKLVNYSIKYQYNSGTIPSLITMDEINNLEIKEDYGLITMQYPKYVERIASEILQELAFKQ